MKHVYQNPHYNKKKLPIRLVTEEYQKTVIDKKYKLFELPIYNKEITKEHQVNNSNVSLDHIKRLVIFGDSLSDSEGRMKSKTFGVMLSSKQYNQGRFTNGFVWPDFISSDDYLKKYMKNREGRNDFKLLNYSEGGSVAAKYSTLNPMLKFVSNMNRQIHKHEKKGGFQKGDMVVLSLGSNDYMMFNKTDVTKVIKCYEEVIKKMVTSKGVKNFLIMGVPDLSMTAYAHKKSKSYKAKALSVSSSHNQALKQKITELQKQFSNNGVKISFFDFFDELNVLKNMASKLGYNTTNPNQKGYIDLSHVFGLKSKSQSFDPAHRYVFHDAVHPSQEVHQVLASRICDYIASNFGKK